ncbi:sensor histidine kinase KdpD [Planococcus sp. NCCP-2050]|uniref:sensor histidine kinase n=1 Tax=Planococcus sp. NCCP-2050 TaxID=2944679 RepID=UPI002041B7BF|nr:HAMP domain-containing sensor histidine kinase [Planococcus sp. NCCP-2050]GKW45544.1 two-component sensor histidine kinase [Planococcus sp. NCCP-2050]
MKKWIWLITLAIILVASFSVLESGKDYFGKSYLDTIDFDNDLSFFENSLIALELDPLDAEDVGAVTQEQIEEYRTRYGTLSEQIQSIQNQYATDIEEATANGNASVEKILTEERDNKIEAIRSNFADDNVVKEKIIAERKNGLEKTIQELNRQKLSFKEDYDYFVYHLTDIDTGKTFEKGELTNNPYFKKEYTPGNPLSMDSEYFYGSEVQSTEFELPLSDANFEGIIQIDRKLLSESFNGSLFDHFIFTKYMLYVMAGLAVGGIVLLLTKLPFNRAWFTDLRLNEKWSNLPLEARLFLLVLTLLLALPYGSGKFINMLQYSWSDNMLRYGSGLAWQFALAVVFIALAILQIIWMINFYKNWNHLEHDIKNSSIFNSFKTASQAFLKKSIGVQMLILLFVVFTWGMGTMAMVFVREVIIIWIPTTLFIGIPVLLFTMNRFGYLNILMRDTAEMADGRLNQNIPVRGRSPLADHARQLTRLKEGVRLSMSEQAKSERLKTELITNVSHDLRTPLTSIITYTDLMKTPNLSEEERLSYANILDRKSQRLKTLIEDLFEVSKMASGNMELNRTRLDLNQLLLQALAEHAEDIEASGLDFRVTSPENPIYVQADGQKWWRVLDNLILNAIKYAMPGTRVYINLQERDGQAEFTIKNVTRYELGENTDELFERFKRGDTSRQTEGSGLGLAIAQSIVDLHGGEMKIEVDGDLFKVIVSINSL